MSASTYFNRSRLQVIGLITAATVVVGGLGAVAGLAFDADPVEADPAPVPGSATGSGGGQAKLLLANLAAEGDGTYVPLANGVEIFVADGWSVLHQDEVNIFLTNEAGAYAYAYSDGGYDPAGSAASLILDNIDGILPPENYTQRQVGEVYAWSDPFGTVGASVGVEYQALWVDDQGSAPIYGQIYAGVRQDGAALLFLIENIPPEGFNDAYDNAPLVTNTFVRFGGVS